jgi:hypothetical protein
VCASLGVLFVAMIQSQQITLLVPRHTQQSALARDES